MGILDLFLTVHLKMEDRGNSGWGKQWRAQLTMAAPGDSGEPTVLGLRSTKSNSVSSYSTSLTRRTSGDGGFFVVTFTDVEELLRSTSGFMNWTRSFPPFPSCSWGGSIAPKGDRNSSSVVT
jgi:hypothetical protein